MRGRNQVQAVAPAEQTHNETVPVMIVRPLCAIHQYIVGAFLVIAGILANDDIAPPFRSAEILKRFFLFAAIEAGQQQNGQNVAKYHRLPRWR